MSTSQPPLTRERILAAAAKVIRRFGPAKATVVDVAQVLGVSHAAVYRHVASKAQLRDLVVGQWIAQGMPTLLKAAKRSGPAPQRLRRFIDALIASKRTKAAADPELFTAYRTFAADAKSVVAAHVDQLIQLTAGIVSDGVKEGTFRPVEPISTAKAILSATTRFHHPAHAVEWKDPGIDDAFEAIWDLLMKGLRPVR